MDKQLTITKVFRENKTAKSGKPYESLRIQTREYGDKWLSGFGRQSNKTWKEGDTITVKVVEKGEYLNFEEAPSERPQLLTRAEFKNHMTLRIEPMLARIYEAIRDPQGLNKKDFDKKDFVAPGVEYPGPAPEPNFDLSDGVYPEDDTDNSKNLGETENVPDEAFDDPKYQ